MLASSETLPSEGHNRNVQKERSDIVKFAWSAIRFNEDKSSCEIVKEYDALVKPSLVPVSPQLLHDMGITEEDLVAAPTLGEAVQALDDFVKTVVGSSSFCIVTHGKWDIIVVLRHVAHAYHIDLSTSDYLFDFHDIREIYTWWFSLQTSPMEPKSTSLANICETFDLNILQGHSNNSHKGIKYAKAISKVMSLLVPSIPLRSNPHSIPFPSSVNWLKMVQDFSATRGVLLKVMDVPFTATSADILDWLRAMGVNEEPLLCHRQLHPERLRPSGTAFIKFSSHEAATHLLLNNGVKLSSRCPHIESTTQELMERTTTCIFPPSPEEFQASKSCVLRLGSLYWNTSYTDIVMWSHGITGMAPVGAWMACLPDGRSTGVGWVKFADPNAALRLLYAGMNDKLPFLYDRSIIVDPSDDKEIEFAQSIATLMPFPDWVYLPVPMQCVGLIIGKNGARIANIAKTLKVKINAPRRGENPVFSIFGVPHRIYNAKSEIEKITTEWFTTEGKKTSERSRGDDKGDRGYGVRGGGRGMPHESYMTPYTNHIFGGGGVPPPLPAYSYPAPGSGGGGGGSGPTAHHQGQGQYVGSGPVASGDREGERGKGETRGPSSPSKLS